MLPNIPKIIGPLPEWKKFANQMKDTGLMPEPVGRYQISISTHSNKGVFESIIDTRISKRG